MSSPTSAHRTPIPSSIDPCWHPEFWRVASACREVYPRWSLSGPATLRHPSLLPSPAGTPLTAPPPGELPDRPVPLPWVENEPATAEFPGDASPDGDAAIAEPVSEGYLPRARHQPAIRDRRR